MPSLNTKLASAPNTQTNYVLKATSSTTIGNSLIFDNGTNVGIGTTTLNARLDVQAAATSAFSYYFRNAAGGYGGGIYNTGSNNTQLYLATSAGTENILLNSSGSSYFNGGNIGIGTSNPTSKLMIYGSSSGNVFTNLVSNQGGSTQVGINFAPSMTDTEIASNPVQASIYTTDSNYGANIIFANKTTGAVGNSLVERMRINQNGDIRIGDITGADGRVMIKTSSAVGYAPSGYNGTNANIRLMSGGSPTTNTTTGISFGIGGAAEAYIGAVQNSSSYADIVFQNYDGAYRERMRITSGGNIGIGNTGLSGQRVRINGETNDSSGYSFVVCSANGTDLFNVRNDGLMSSGGSLGPFNFNPGGRVMYVNSSGQIGSNPSTRESKININPISDVSYIYDLNPVSFYFRKTNMETYEYTDEYYDEIRYGFIADEVEPLNTDLVSYDVKEDGTKKMAGVEYISMIPVLVKALQEQKKEIEELKALINK